MSRQDYPDKENDYITLLADLIIDQYIERRKNPSLPPTEDLNIRYNVNTKDE